MRTHADAGQASAGVTYLFGDHLGSTSAAIDPNGQLTKQGYYAFGGVRYNVGTLPTDYTFTGQKSDASDGLLFYNARYYDPQLGRFIQPDTIIPNVYNPQTFNPYSYVINNPLSYTDPTGSQPCNPDVDPNCYGGGGYPCDPSECGTITPVPPFTPTQQPTPTLPATPTPAEQAKKEKEKIELLYGVILEWFSMDAQGLAEMILVEQTLESYANAMGGRDRFREVIEAGVRHGTRNKSSTLTIRRVPGDAQPGWFDSRGVIELSDRTFGAGGGSRYTDQNFGASNPSDPLLLIGHEVGHVLVDGIRQLSNGMTDLANQYAGRVRPAGEAENPFYGPPGSYWNNEDVATQLAIWIVVPSQDRKCGNFCPASTEQLVRNVAIPILR